MQPPISPPESEPSQLALAEGLIHLAVKVRELGRQLDRLEAEMRRAVNEATVSRFEE
jgi:hypothetical protein